MADRDNGKVEHPLTLGPRHWEEGVQVYVCVHETGAEGTGSRVGDVCLEKRVTLWSPETHKLKYTLGEITESL